MPTQFRLPTPPRGAQEINAEVAILRERGQVAYFAAGVPVFVHAEDDPVGRRVAAAQLLELGLAQPHELSAALHVNRSTLYRQQRKLKTDGVLGVVDGKRGPRGPHRFTPKKRQRVTAYAVDVTGERRAEHPRSFTKIEVVHRLRGHDVSPAAVEEAIRLSDTKYCSVHFSLDPGIEMTSRYEIAPA